MAVTANQVVKRQDGCRGNHPVAASTRLHEGTIVFTVPGSGFADDDTGSGANAFAGIAVAEADNTSGAAGDKKVEVYRDGVFELEGSGFVQADVGSQVHASDNFTVTVTRTATTVYVGTIVGFVSSTKVRVAIDPNLGDPAAPIADAGAAYTATEQGIINSIINALETHGIVEPT